MGSNNFIDELSDYLQSTFEDNVAMVFSQNILPIDQQVSDPVEQRKINARYEKARKQYLDAVADYIRNCEVLD